MPGRIFACVLFLVFSTGCSRFNREFLSNEYFVFYGGSKLQFVKLSTDRNSLESVETLTPSVTPTYVSVAQGLLSYSNGTTLVTLSALGTARTQLSQTALGSPNQPSLLSDRKAIYYSDGTDLKVRLITNGVLASSDAQTFDGGVFFGGNAAAPVAMGSDSSFVLLGAASPLFYVMTRNSNGTLGTVTASTDTTSEFVTRFDSVPALGANHFVAGINAEGPRLVRATASSVSLVATFGNAWTYGVHPTQPWIYFNSIANLSRYLITASGFSLAGSSTVPTLASSLSRMVFSTTGDRMVGLNVLGAHLFSCASDGTITFLSSLSIESGATDVKVLEIGRSI